MSNNKFDALGSDDSEGEGDPGQTLVEVSEQWAWSLMVLGRMRTFLKVEKGAFTPLAIPEGEHRLQSQYCLWYRLDILSLEWSTYYGRKYSEMYPPFQSKGSGQAESQFWPESETVGQVASIAWFAWQSSNVFDLETLWQVCHLWTVLGNLQSHGETKITIFTRWTNWLMNLTGGRFKKEEKITNAS